MEGPGLKGAGGPPARTAPFVENPSAQRTTSKCTCACTQVRGATSGMGGGLRSGSGVRGAGESSEKHLLIKIRRVGAAVVFFPCPKLVHGVKCGQGRAVIVTLGIIAPLLSRRAPLQVSALRLRGHPVRLAQVSPAAPPPGAEERSRPRATPRATAPFPAGFGPVVRSQGGSAACDLGRGQSEPPASREWRRAGVPSEAR